MPRPWQETIQPWPELSSDQDCRCAVIDVAKSRGPHGIRVVLRHLDGPHAGRTHEVLFSLPIRPSGLTSEFFAACGLSVAVGGTIGPSNAVGAIISVRFAHADGDDWQSLGFESSKHKEERHVSGL
jgi:hypothetical protein